MERKEILVADKITKIYGIGTKTLYEALHEVSLTMYEFVCIMGPSGAGKSTFINNLSTIDIPTKGKVFINGKEVRVMSEGEIGKFRYENLGFIFQEFNLLDSLTIFENIAVPLTLANVDKKEIKKRWSEIDMDSKEYRRHEAKIDRAISVISLAAAVVVLGAVLILKYMR